MRVLMVGATGNFASLLVPELKKRSVTVRALLHDDSKAVDAKRNGADETAAGDLKSEESLRRALADVDGVFHLGPAFAPDEAQMGLNMIKAAAEAGVRKFVFSGLMRPSIVSMGHHAAKLPVEEAIYESGLEFTVLQPTAFMQNFAGAWPQIAQHGVFALPYSSHAKLCYVDYRDVAEAAALAFTTDKLAYGTFELSAPGMFDRVQIAELMSNALGRTVQATEPSFAEWAQQAHIPEGPMREGLSRMYTHYDRYGFPGGNALVLRAILGREPRTLEQYIGELAQQGQGIAA
jgi:uncharacterized protein YbjT (DUF2867 family)